MVLEEIGAEATPQLMLYNKVDLLDGEPEIERNAQGVVTKVWVSSIDGAGKELLLEAIAERIGEAVIETNVTVRPEDGRIRAQFFELGAVLQEIPCEDGSVEMHLRIQESSLRKITRDKRTGQSVP